MNRQCKTKYIFYGLGILILTLGISFTIHSNLGTSPFDALLVGLSKKVGLTVGSWEIVIALLLIFCNSLLKRKRPEFLGLITSCITGFGIDMWLFLLNHFITPEQWFTKFVFFGLGLIVIGLGTAIYLQTNFAPIPVDHLMLIIRELTGMSMMFSKTLIYLLFLKMAFIFNGPIGIGTIFTVCVGGPILNYFMPLVTKGLNTHTETNTATTSEKDKTHSV
ncbi:YitT family protein [Bacillus sp. BRMEA1]|uniref:YczE/YyaS/YitT family protein n=1 Tax=Neobacillus endophyticus TaxID=2738405 RepID=UPI001567757D|nr:YitT family protein [Neobacillus endophyticus]NRD79898.1 YitT family protein [Neobacillus endophyticus]